MSDEAKVDPIKSLAERLDEALRVTDEHAYVVDDAIRAGGVHFGIKIHNARLRPALLALLESASAGGGIPGPPTADEWDVAIYKRAYSPAMTTIHEALSAVFADRYRRFRATHPARCMNLTPSETTTASSTSKEV